MHWFPKPGDLAKFKIDAYSPGIFGSQGIQFSDEGGIGSVRKLADEVNGYLVEIINIIDEYDVEDDEQQEIRICLVGSNLYRTVVKRRLEPI